MMDETNMVIENKTRALEMILKEIHSNTSAIGGAIDNLKDLTARVYGEDTAGTDIVEEDVPGPAGEINSIRAALQLQAQAIDAVRVLSYRLSKEL